MEYNPTAQEDTMQATTTPATPYDADELMQLYHCKGRPDNYRFTLANFETRPCSRCGGCGQYSYCQQYGTMCFGCQGTGFQLTKRGHAALLHWRALLSKPVSEIEPGTPVRDQDSKRCTITAVEPTQRYVDGEWVPADTGHVDITYNYSNGPVRHCNMPPTTLVRVRSWTAEQLEEHRQAALAYQASLTKAGAPRKR